MQKELDGFKIDPKHIEATENKSLVNFTKYLEDIQLEKVNCTCKGNLKTNACKKILPTADNTKDIVVYNNCKRTLLAACKRQLREQPSFNKRMVTGKSNPNGKITYKQFCDKIFKNEIIPILENFDYNVHEWYNHLTAKKQKEIDEYLLGGEIKGKDLTTYGMFCKREKQIIDDKMPKNRAITAPHHSKKYVCGPVIWALEHLFGKHFKGYCGGKNWDELETLYEEYYKQGYVHTLQGDGSAFDSTQTYDLKYIDRLIAEHLVKKDKIKHVDPKLFKLAMTARLKQIDLKLMTSKTVKNIGSVTVDGTVFSGDPDTTFGNTLRMAMYIRYTMYLAGYEENEFQLICKGDDFAVFMQKIITQVQWENYKGYRRSKYTIAQDDLYYAIKTSFYQVWHPADTQYQKDDVGLGMVLKFLNIGDFQDLDFCSTNVIQYQEGQNTKFKIIRKPDRMTPLSHWSCDALSYSSVQLKQYYLDLAVSMECWAKNMPFFEDYITAYRFHASQVKLKKGQKLPKPLIRKTLDVNPSIYGKLRGDCDTRLYDHYDRDFNHAYNVRQSSRCPPRETVYAYLEDRFKINELELKQGMYGKSLSTTLWVDAFEKLAQ